MKIPFSAFAIRCGTLAAVATATLSTVRADENFFGYTYGAETLPKGKWEAYSWTTARLGKGPGHYTGFDFQQELEYGITDRLQMSFYFTERYHSYAIEEDGAAKRLHRFSYDGNQLEFKYSVLSPYKDAVGLALYVEPRYSLIEKGPGDKVLELEMETKVILQKNFLDDQLITALNVSTEFAWNRPRPSGGERFDTELVLEVTGGISYRIAPRWFVGVEARYETAFPNMDLHAQESWAFFAGPALHYGGERWWATLTWLPQLTGDAPGSARSSRLDLEHHERQEIRLKVGYDF